MRKNLKVYSGISILFVVLIHSNAYYLNHISLNETSNVMKLLINMEHIAVPMFIFIAGYKYELTKKNRDIKKYYKSKINNIIKPTLIISILWIVLFLLLAIVKKGLNGQNIDVFFYIKVLFYRIGQIFIGNNDIYQLWYIPMYILITFSYPFIEKYVKGYKRMVIFSGLAIFQSIGSGYINILGKHPLDFIYYFAFFEMGILFYRKENKINLNRVVIFIIYSTSLIASVYILDEIISKILVRCIIYPAGVIAFYYIAQYLQNSKIFNILGEYSFSIYVLHEPVVLSALGSIVEKMRLYNNWIWVPIISSLGIITCIYIYKFTLMFKVGKLFWNKQNYLANIKKTFKTNI